jgi:hypothetical protein
VTTVTWHCEQPDRGQIRCLLQFFDGIGSGRALRTPPNVFQVTTALALSIIIKGGGPLRAHRAVLFARCYAAFLRTVFTPA